MSLLNILLFNNAPAERMIYMNLLSFGLISLTYITIWSDYIKSTGKLGIFARFAIIYMLLMGVGLIFSSLFIVASELELITIAYFTSTLALSLINIEAEKRNKKHFSINAIAAYLMLIIILSGMLFFEASYVSIMIIFVLSFMIEIIYIIKQKQ